MTKKLLDLYCGSGGAGVGYARAGFEVTGVDIKKRMCGYPAGEFIKADVLEILKDRDFLRSFDVIHASPPCQENSITKHLRDAQGGNVKERGINLIPETKQALFMVHVPFIIENVEDAPLHDDILLCGSMFPELHVMDETGKRWLKRHRIFEVWGYDLPRYPSECAHKAAGVRPLGVYASKADNIPSGGQTARTLEEGRALMGIDWMNWSALVEAIPPVYTEWIGSRILECM